MKYLILGSAGQVGLSLCEYLKTNNHEVIGFDIINDPRQDLRIPNNILLEQAVSECDFVFHLAWDVGGSTYLAKYQDTFDFINNNLKIISNSFDAIKKYNKPFIFASSQMASMSYSSYGLTKNLAEKVVASLNGITVKFWNVYGIEHDPEKTHVVTDFINKARNTRIINMRTNGTELRQMLHADDCSRCLVELSNQYDQLPRDREYHISSFEWNSMLDVAHIIADYYPDTVIQPSTAHDTVQKDAQNEPDPWILNFWQPKIKLNDGVRSIIEYIEKESK